MESSGVAVDKDPNTAPDAGCLVLVSACEDRRAAGTALLVDAGFDVSSRSGGAAGLAALRRAEARVVVVDATLPDMTGRELIRAGRRFDPTIAWILVDSNPRAQDVVSALRDGVTDYLDAALLEESLAGAARRAVAERSATFGNSTLSAGTELRLLLVEDSRPDAVMVKALLARARDEGTPIRVEWSETLSEALGRLSAEEYDLVLTDLFLPDGDGLETFVRLYAAAPLVPIVVLTGSIDDRVADQAVQCGAQDYIIKGEVTAAEMVSRIRFARERHETLLRLERFARELDAGERSLQRLVHSNAHGTLVVEEAGTIRFADPAAGLLYGREPESLLGRHLGFDPAEPPDEIDVGGRQGAATVGVRVSRTTWGGAPAWLVILKDESEWLEVEAALRDLNLQLRQANARLETLANVDPLTGLLNRRGLERALASEVDRRARGGHSLAALLVDCDDFKSVNDTLGHAVGDVVLREMADRLAAQVRPSDHVGRIGGDEFLVLLPEARSGEAMVVAHRLRLAVTRSSLVVGEKEMRVTVSVGVANLGDGISTIEEALVAARTGLTRSKARGKNRVADGSARASEDDHEEETERTLAAMTRGEGLRGVAQPIVALTDGEVLGYELLARGPVGPLEAPYHFLTLALERDRLTPVDIACLRACTARAAELPTRCEVHLNVFPSTLLAVEVAQLRALLPSDRPASRVVLEISEQQFIGDPSALSERVAELRSAGYRVAIDDVGFGRTSLETLLVLAPEVIKIDRSYVDGAAASPAKSRLLRRLVAALQPLGAELIAEGVEREEDAATLRSFGVPLAQGWLFGRPA